MYYMNIYAELCRFGRPGEIGQLIMAEFIALFCEDVSLLPFESDQAFQPQSGYV